MRFRDDLELRRRVAEEAARAGGAVHRKYRGQELARTIHDGERADYATQVDFEAQEAVREVVARYFPYERVIGEEDENFDDIEEEMERGCWFTDPLDGTQEFVHGAPGYSCIVVYVEHGAPQACAAYFDAWGEMFSAADGLGATLNGTKLRVSGQQELTGAVFSTAYRGSEVAKAQGFAERFVKLVPHVEGFRMPGAPSVMACGLAAGRYDLYVYLTARFEPPPARPFVGQPWETGAFILLVREAGGAVQPLRGEGDYDVLGHNIYAASSRLIEQFRVVMGEM
jgi:myo-inositol-1(or 4)-monophosphatase